MSECSESGGVVAWRLLATLEAGSLLVGGAALLAHLVRPRPRCEELPLKSVFISNTSSPLGKELTKQLQSQGCRVVTDGAPNGAISKADRQVDALIVVGAEPKTDCLEGLTELVSEDVYANLKILEALSKRVRPGGRLVWAACKGEAESGAFSGASAAFDDMLRTQLDFIAKTCQCKSVWVGRRTEVEQVAKAVVSALLPTTSNSSSRFSVRNMAAKVSGYVWRWLKIVS